MKIIVGLGNPGARYAYTYHNVGFLAAEAFADKIGARFKIKKCDSLLAREFYAGEDFVVAKPQTFMNLSGVAVRQLLKKFKAAPADLVVVYDDIDIEKGTLRFREKGSAGTHNGMRSIISEIGTGDFKRLRIGIGRPADGQPLADYVLSQVRRDEREMFFTLLGQAAEELLRI